MRRLPIYLLADLSGSMAGTPIQALWRLFEDIIFKLKNDPYALETAIVSLITYSSKVEMTPFCELDSFKLPQLPKITTGPKNCGLALERFLESYNNDIKKDSVSERGDWAPIIFLGTCGNPSDVAIFNHAVDRIKALNIHQIYIFHGNDSKKSSYLSLSDNIFPLYNYDISSLMRGLWVGMTIEDSNPKCSEELPPPPAEVNIVI